MNARGFPQSAGAVVTLAIVCACSSTSTLVAPTAAEAPIAEHVRNLLVVDGQPVTAERFRTFPTVGRFAPQAARADDYEYVFNTYQSYGTIFDYPASTKMIGLVQDAGGQGCTNVLYGYGHHTFWNAGRNHDSIEKYAVPDQRIGRLPVSYQYTSSCAMDTSGDLAVGVLLGNSGGQGGQEIFFKKSTGRGVTLISSLYEAFFAGYDEHGNLWADGMDQNGKFQFAEIPKGATHGKTIATSNSPLFPGSVQWDGTYVTVFDQEADATYRYTISGSKATLKGTVQYSGAGDCAQTWIVPGLMYCGDNGNDDGEVFKYPAGGAPVATFTGEFDSPLGVVAVQE